MFDREKHKQEVKKMKLIKHKRKMKVVAAPFSYDERPDLDWPNGCAVFSTGELSVLLQVSWSDGSDAVILQMSDRHGDVQRDSGDSDDFVAAVLPEEVPQDQ